jgi:hypothetical protein
MEADGDVVMLDPRAGEVLAVARAGADGTIGPAPSPKRSSRDPSPRFSPPRR